MDVADIQWQLNNQAFTQRFQVSNINVNDTVNIPFLTIEDLKPFQVKLNEGEYGQNNYTTLVNILITFLLLSTPVNHSRAYCYNVWETVKHINDWHK